MLASTTNSRLSARLPVTDPVARIQVLADQCVQCALCLPHCPTYAHDRLEGESPRGRIALARALAGGRLDPADGANWLALDHCLGCRRCEPVCPAGVQYGELLVEARRLQRSYHRPPLRQRLLEALVRRPALLAAAFGSARRVRTVLPARLQRRIPRSRSPRDLFGRHPAHGERRGTVGLFLGCIAGEADAAVHRAAISVLTRLGWDVQVPATQGCCGAMHRHAGDVDRAAVLAAGNRDAFGEPALDAVIVSASGCFDSVRRACGDAATRELLAFVAASLPGREIRWQPLPRRVALHVPCTQGSVVRANDVSAALLANIPGLQRLPVRGHGCCGAAGSHMLLQPQRAAAIRQPLLDEIIASDADLLASGNIGCRLHLQAGLEQQSRPLPVRHPIELLAEALA